ncbi:MAG: fasciclin domain-containing protein [Myxococcota bacterium]|nr:fasciclin domain-containing protein [Myxococcota bacterium]
MSVMLACGGAEESEMTTGDDQAGTSTTTGGRSNEQAAGRPSSAGDAERMEDVQGGRLAEQGGMALAVGGTERAEQGGTSVSGNADTDAVGGQRGPRAGRNSTDGQGSGAGMISEGAGRPSSGAAAMAGRTSQGGMPPAGGSAAMGGDSGPQAGRGASTVMDGDGGNAENSRGGDVASLGGQSSNLGGSSNVGGMVAGGTANGGDDGDDPLANLGGFVPQGPSVWDVVSERAELTRFADAVEQAGLDTALDSPSAYTVFAPSDDAFNAYPGLQDLLSNRAKLLQTLNYHLHYGELTTAEIRTRNQVATVGGLSLVVTFDNDSIRLNGAQLVVTNIEASNGLIHIVDAVMDVQDAPRPSTLVEVLEADERFQTFARLVRETNYDQELSEEGPFTVFAPTDEAFDRLNAEQEGYVSSLDFIQKEQLVASHLVEDRYALNDLQSTNGVVNFRGINLPIEQAGAGVSIAGAVVSEADIGADNPDLNGLVHATRQVIFRERNRTLYELLSDDGRFTVFLGLVADVMSVERLLKNVAWDDLITVFAPVDEAFGDQDLEALRNNAAARIDFLNRHITTGEYYADDLAGLQRLSMRNGRFISLNVDGQNNIRLENAVAIETDLYAHNGMAHVLNEAIQIPEAPEPATCDAPRALALNTPVVGNNDNASGVERFQLTAMEAGPVCVSTVGSPIDTVITARLVCNDGDVIAQNDNVLDGVMFQSQLTLNVDVDTPYYVNIGSTGGPGDFVVDVTAGACQSPLSILDIIEILPGFDSFLISLQIAGLIDRLEEPDANLTVIAVTEAGFDRLDMFEDGASELLLGDTPRLTLVIAQHLVPGIYPTTVVENEVPQLTWPDSLQTLNGQAVEVEPKRVGQATEDIRLDGHSLAAVNYTANNGVVHVIDRLLEPKVPCPHPELSCAIGQVCLSGFCAEPPPPRNLWDELSDAGQFTELLALLEAAEMREQLQFAEAITIFAPTDDVFSAIEMEEPGKLETLKEDTNALRHLLNYHIISHDLTAHGLFAIDRVLTLNGLVLEIDAGPLGVNVGSATVENALRDEDMRVASNGRYHPITGLLSPPIPQPVGSCDDPIITNQAGRIIGTTLGENQQTEMDTVCTETCGPANSPESVIEFRPRESGNYCLYTEYSAYDTVISVRTRCLDETSEVECNDDSAFAGSYFSAVELKDAVAEQSYFVVVDGCSRRNRPAGEGGNYMLTIRNGLCSNPDTIVDRLQAQNAKFRTTLHALRVSGLDDLLEREAKHTFFAPTEQAWETLEEVDPGIVQRLTDQPAEFREVLLYHLVAGERSSQALNDAGTVDTLKGQFLEIFKRGDSVFANGHSVSDVDLQADNGLIHAVESVLLLPQSCDNPADCGNAFRCLDSQCMSLQPPGTIIDELAASGQFTTFLAFAEATDLTRTLENAAPLTVFAPTDEAFQLFRQRDAAGYQDVLDRPEEMYALVLYHIVTGEEPESALLMTDTLTTDEGNTIELGGEAGRISVNGKFLIETDRPAFNGMIHTLDGVLRPPQEPDACAAPIQISVDQGAQTGTTIDRGSRYQSTCGGLAESKEVVFQYRPEQDERVCISTDGSRFDTVLHIREEECEDLSTQANCPDAVDLTCCNDDSEFAGDFASALTLNARAGVDYFIFVDGFGGDQEGDYSLRITTGACGQQPPTANITDLLTDDGRFTIFLQGLTSAGIQQALGSDDELHTVFAPTDDAFTALGERIAADPSSEYESLDDLVRDRAVFGQLIKYHVSEGQSYSDQLASRETLPSLAENEAGQRFPLLFQMFGSQVVVTDVLVNDIDVAATNGVVHTLDDVLTIPAPCLADAECGDEQVCGNVGYCIKRPQPGTCQAPFRIQGLQSYSDDTGPDSANAAFNYLQGSCGGGAGVEHVWLFEPPLIDDEMQEYCFITAGSDFDTILYARRNRCGEGSAELTCNDNNRFITGEQTGSSAITVRATAGDLVYVIVDGWQDVERGDYDLEVRIGSCEGG